MFLAPLNRAVPGQTARQYSYATFRVCITWQANSVPRLLQLWPEPRDLRVMSFRAQNVFAPNPRAVTFRTPLTVRISTYNLDR